MSRLSIDSVNWKEFFIGGEEGLFNIKSTSSGIDKNKIIDFDGNVPYITRSNLNNGIDMFVGEKQSSKFKIDKGNVITIGLDTQTVFYQPKCFFTGQNIQIIENEFLSKEIAMFLVPLLKIQMEKFNWGSTGATLTRLNRTKILLPICSNGNPNWKFMENYIKQEQKIQAQRLIDYYEQRIIECGFELLGFEDVKWRKFYIEELFEFGARPAKELNHLNKLNSGLNYIVGNKKNNEVKSYAESKGNCIAFIINSEGSRRCSIYKEDRSIDTQEFLIGYNKNLDEYSCRFITRVVNKIEREYNFCYKNLQELKKEILQLPIDENGDPHWEYMRMFMQRTEHCNSSEMLEYIKDLSILMGQSYYSLSRITTQWKEFWIEDIVEIKSGVRLTKADQATGKRPFIGSSDNNNGVTGFVSNVNNSLDKNLLGVNYNGSVVDNFYHPYECIFSDDVKRLKFKDKIAQNKYCYLFLKQSILKQKSKYAYGYKFNAARMKRQKIMLPINTKGIIDYDFIKKYMVIQEIKEIYQIIHYLV